MLNRQVRASHARDRAQIADVITTAFEEEGGTILQLVDDLLIDPTAQPCLSLVAELHDEGDDKLGDRIVGHILFSAVQIQGDKNRTKSMILAPLAVHPDRQNQGIGGQLIQAGLEQLTTAGVELVFVLGYPEYYQRHGFAPAGTQGFEATYPIAPEQADAWMVQALRPGVLGQVQGRVLCATALDHPMHW
jgi:predicted N-acetyltransferase YhbS